jgi:hypothetical protein
MDGLLLTLRIHVGLSTLRPRQIPCTSGARFQFTRHELKSRYFGLWQVPGGLMFPDEATMYLAGIEDQDYKEEKIGCTSIFLTPRFGTLAKC